MGGGASKPEQGGSSGASGKGKGKTPKNGGGGKKAGKGKSGKSGKGGKKGGGSKSQSKKGGGGGKKRKKKQQEEIALKTFVFNDGRPSVQTFEADDGTLYYLDVDENDWVRFPSSWKREGKFENFQRVVFRVWTDVGTGAEYLTFEEAGVRYYCDFELEEWVQFPAEWEDPARGTFGDEVDPDEWAANHQTDAAGVSAEPQVSTYTDEDGRVYTTYMGEEVTQVWYYLDDEERKWKKMPKRWVRDMKQKEGLPLDEDEEAMLLGGAVDQSDHVTQLENELIKVKAKLKLAEKKAKAGAEAEVLKASLQDENAKTETRFEEIMASNKQLSKEKLELKKKVRELTKNNRRLKKEAQNKVERLESETAALRDSTAGGDTKLQAVIEAKDREIEQLTAKVSQMSAALHAASDAQDSVRAVSSTMGSLDRQTEELRREAKELRREVWEQKELFATLIADFGRQLDGRLGDSSRLVTEYKAKYRAESMKRKVLYNKLQELRGNIRVYCRARGLGRDEQQAGFTQCTSFPDENELVIRSEDGKAKSFEFDMVFGPDAQQEDVFSDMEPLITSVVDGYNVCVFAYGQTGAGKTYTMMGPRSNRGVNFRALDTLFRITQEDPDSDYQITANYLEIYNEQIRDLMNPEEVKAGWGGKSKKNKLEVKRRPNGSMHVPGITEIEVRSTRDVMDVMERGDRARATTATAMNDVSSRSHSVLTIEVSGQNNIDGTSTYGKLTLVDLAGSERVGKSKAQGTALQEAAAINKSLSALGNCINALGSRRGHVPYRDSKLTYLLMDSLDPARSCKVLLFLCIRSSSDSYSESVCSLQFGQRARAVVLGQARKNAPSGGAKPRVPVMPSGVAASIPMPPGAGHS